MSVFIDTDADAGAWNEAIGFLPAGVVADFNYLEWLIRIPGIPADWGKPSHDHGSETPNALGPAASNVVPFIHSPASSDEGQHSDAR